MNWALLVDMAVDPTGMARLIRSYEGKDDRLPEDPYSTVVRTVRALLRRREQGDVLVASLPEGTEFDQADLYDDLQFDSLEVAELSAILEDDLGRDPYTEGLVPRTVAEVVAFYTG